MKRVVRSRRQVKGAISIALGQVGKGDCNNSIVTDKSAVKTYETEQHLNIVDTTQERPLRNSLDALRLYKNTLQRNDKPQEWYLYNVELVLFKVRE